MCQPSWDEYFDSWFQESLGPDIGIKHLANGLLYLCRTIVEDKDGVKLEMIKSFALQHNIDLG